MIPRFGASELFPSRHLPSRTPQSALADFHVLRQGFSPPPAARVRRVIGVHPSPSEAGAHRRGNAALAHVVDTTRPCRPFFPISNEPFSIFPIADSQIPIPDSQIPIPNSPRWSEMQYLYNETCGCPVLQFTGGRNSCHRFSRNGRRENHLGRHRRTPPHGHTPSLI